MKPRLSLGQVVATPGVLAALRKSGENPMTFLRRHVAGDWGLVTLFDQKQNDLALKEGSRILSAYRTSLGEVLWVITEADRSSTCLLLPQEY